MPRRVSASTARPAAATATVTTASASSTTTTIVANSTTAEDGSAAAGPSSSKSLPLSPAQAGSSSAILASASASASKLGDGTQAAASRPRRIMPSRSRKGGPGVGISDVDTHILETLRRRRENEPLIPAHAQFLLTTNAARVRTFGEASKTADGDSESGSQLNTWAYERYFDKPEVIRAYREQQLIQTPEFTLLSEHEAVGGRFRPRSLDDEGIDTSDAAYEKRHRKYETFEKRQRLREKEKLKHEHYKLKERIEQLRALEHSAFLSASDSFFTGSSRPPPHQGNPDAQGSSTTDVPVPMHNEGEWRKRQMLDVANSLDARYRTLLDTAPLRAPDLPTPTPPPPTPAPSAPATPIPASPLGHTPNTTVRRSPGPTPGPARATSATAPRSQSISLTPLPPTEVIELDSDGEEATPEFVKAEPMTGQSVLVRHDTTESLKLRIKFPSRQPPAVSSISTQPPLPSSPSSPRPSAARIASGSPNPKASISASGSPSPSRPRPKPIFKNPAAPSQYVRTPFAKHVQPQDVVAPTVVDDTTLPSTLSSLSPRQTASPTLSSNSATHLTLRRRSARATGFPKVGSPATAPSPSEGGVTTSLPKQQPPLAHGHGTGRLRKRRRVELSDEDEENLRFDSGDSDDDAINGVIENGRGEEGEEEAEGGSEEEWQRARWRESALYREAQRHAGAPSARKTHRHLGIFGLKGFPAEIENLHDFVIPQWALPLGDPRLVEEQQRQRQQQQQLVQEHMQEERRVETIQARGSERTRLSFSGAPGGAGQRRLRDTVAALAGKAGGEESTSCSKSDQLVVETPSAVDSQVTEG